jgi:hypothetical protein
MVSIYSNVMLVGKARHGTLWMWNGDLWKEGALKK